MHAYILNVIIAEPVRAPGGKLVGVVVASLSHAELSDPPRHVVKAQQQQGRRLLISILDSRGELIAMEFHCNSEMK
jgi:hypothetical protein